MGFTKIVQLLTQLEIKKNVKDEETAYYFNCMLNILSLISCEFVTLSYKLFELTDLITLINELFSLFLNVVSDINYRYSFMQDSL